MSEEQRKNDLDWLLSTLDCGDNSCLFAEKKTGMRTNGGCRCFKDLPTNKRMFVHKMLYSLRKIKDRK